MPDRILIAHPETGERTRLATIVRTAGFVPVEAADGEQAVALAPGTALAFLTATLPLLDGLATAARLRLLAPAPTLVLLNDVYPSAAPRERLLRDFGLAAALPAPATTEAVARTLFSLDRSPRKGKRDEPRMTDLSDLPLLLLLGRARRKGETGLFYARRGTEARFVTMVAGAVALVRGNRRVAEDESALLADSLLWTSGEAVLYPDPELSAIAAGRIELSALLELATGPPISPALQEAAERSLHKSGRVVFHPIEGSAEIAESTGLTLYERELLALVDGDRSVARIAGLAELGGLPLARLLFRMEVLGILVRRRPGSPRSGVRSATADAPSALLPHASVMPSESQGQLGAGGLARLLVRLEVARATGVVAVRRDGRTVEMALRDGRITGSHAWGGASPEEDPVATLAGVSDLRPDDVPFLRRLHAQKLVVEALRAADCEWTFRKGEAYRMAETLGTNPASMVAELLRSGDLEPMLGGPPAAAQAAAIARALALTRSEASELGAWSEHGMLPPRLWLRSIGSLLDPTQPIGRALPAGTRALPAAPLALSMPPAHPSDALDAMFDKALTEGLADGDRAGAPRADSEILTASPQAPSEDQTASLAAGSSPVPAAVAAGDPAAAAPDSGAEVATQAAQPQALQPVARPSLLPQRPPREPLPPLPEEDVPEDLSSFELALGSGRAPLSFSMEQRPGGVVIRVGDKEYAIDLIIREVEELRRERARMRTELVKRHNLLVEREDEVEAVRKTVHELENFIHELQATLVEREATVAELEGSRGLNDVELAEFRAVLPEKDRLLEQAMTATETVAQDLERAQGRLREKERALEELRRERDSLQTRSIRVENELSVRADAVRDAEERISILKERVNRVEQDLAVARAERDDLTSRIAFQEGEKKRKGFFRDARAEKAAVDERVEKAERLADERRKALEAIQKESVSLSHRVLDLEGQVARREAEMGRYRRERERLEERLSAAQAEAAARAESEAAARARRDASERMLAENVSGLERARAEIGQLRELEARVGRELVELRSEFSAREAELAQTQSQRTELALRVEAADAEIARLGGELRQLREERDRLEWSLDETRQTSARAALALAAVTSSRDELKLGLEESQATLARTAQEREQFFEESCRIEKTLADTRDALAVERTGVARLEAALEKALADITHSRERVTGVERERDESRSRAAELDARRAALEAELQALRRAVAERDEALASANARGSELEAALAQNRLAASALEGELRERTATLDRQGSDLLSLIERLQREKLAADHRHAELLAARESALTAETEALSQAREAERALLLEEHGQELARRRAETAQVRADAERELASAREQLARSEEQSAALQQSESALRIEQAALAGEIESLRNEVGTANRAKAELVRELEQKVASKVAAVQKLEGDLSHLRSEATRIIAAWKEKVRRLEERLQKAATDELVLREALATREAAELALKAELRAAEAQRDEAETRAREKVRDADLRMADVQRSDERRLQAMNEVRARAATLEQELAAATAELGRREAALSSLAGETRRRNDAERDAATALRAELARKDAELQRLSGLVESQKPIVERLENQMAAARKRVAQDVRRISELVTLADDLKARLAERDGILRARETELGHRAAEAEAFRQAAEDKERQLAEAREGVFSLSQHDRDLSQQLAEQEELISNLKADLARLERERTEAARSFEVQSEKLRREREVQDEAIAGQRAELGRSEQRARAAEARERELRADLARRSAAAIPAATSAGDDAALRRQLRETHHRIADLEHELAEQSEQHGAQRKETNALYEEVVAATRALDEAQGEIDRLARELQSRTHLDARRDHQLRELTAALAARDRDLESRAAALAGRDAGLAARDEALARLGARIAELEAARTEGDASTRIRSLEETARAQQEAYALLDETLAARERLVDELERRLAEEKSRSSAMSGEAERVRSAESQLRDRLAQATAALEAAAGERDLRAGLKQQLEQLAGERDRLEAELKRLRPTQRPHAHAARAAAESGAASAGPDLAAATKERGTLIAESNEVNREATRLREAMDRQAAELARLEALLVVEAADSPRRRELLALRDAADEQAHALQASLGERRVRMAELNRRIVDKNRSLQRLMEGGATEPFAAAPGDTIEGTGEAATGDRGGAGEAERSEPR